MHLFGFGKKDESPRKPGRPSPRKTDPSKEDRLPPLLLHFDVNKTVILSDSIKMMTIEEGVREGIAEIFWGYTSKDASGNLNWEWTKTKASCNRPKVEESKEKSLMTYTQYCKEVVKDKKERKEAVKSFSLVKDDATREEMDKLCNVVVTKMQLPQDIRGSRAAMESGLKGSTVVMFPSVFQLVALLQRSGRTFAILFRSFGADHKKIKEEWNAFCEMRHPVFSHLLKGIGPLDGSGAAPDRRIHSLHTIYRDAQGPMLLLDTFTNGPEGKGENAGKETWDAWAKLKPKPATDARDGRKYIHDVVQCQTVDGMPKLQKWMYDHMTKQATAAIKDDWAWWTWNDEESNAGKLMTLLSGREESLQLFFDDNIELSESRIVDCRDAQGAPMDYKKTRDKYLMKVNPVEALLDDEYFIKKLTDCHGAQSSAASAMQFQQHITEVEEQKVALNQQVKVLNMQLQTLTEDIRKMKLLRRIPVRDEAQLRDLLAKDGGSDVTQFGVGSYRKVEDLFMEVAEGHCWLEQEEGRLVRIIEMLFLKIQYKDQILIESHEQDMHGNILRRDYLPGVRKTLKESFYEVQDRFFESGLQANIKHSVKDDVLPVYVPDAPNQQTGFTQAYPIPCKVQQSQAMFKITEKEVETRKELLGKIGLPGGKHFTTTETDIHGTTITRFWRWDKVATWEATVSMAKGNTAGGAQNSMDISQVIEKVFGGHPRREVYENLLLQMFENFTASKLCGGFSGSVVIRVQPFESDGRPSEPCIVKLDDGATIREEYINSLAVFEALPDRAAMIQGEAVYANNKNGEEFGAFRLELAGACWNVPELAQGSANLLTTFKDLLLYESDQILLGEAASTDDVRPFGNVNSVLAETFGPGGIVSSLRKGGKGLTRAEGKPLLSGWYTLKGKPTKFNPLLVKDPGDYPPTTAIRRLYKTHFGGEIPDLKELVVDTIKPQLMELQAEAEKDGLLCPLIGLAHGDLNAANIMIDALDAVWLIDFATSVELPLFTDMCKFEMAGLFEYSVIPITPEVLVDFASRDEENWNKLNVADWLRVSPDIATSMLRELCLVDKDRLAAMTPADLDRLIEEVVAKSGKKPSKQREILGRLKARIVANQAQMDVAFAYCVQASNTVLLKDNDKGDYIGHALDIKAPNGPEGPGAHGASSLMYFMDMSASVRRFMLADVMNLCREQYDNVQPVEALSIQLWLPFLRESYRIIGYRDICPQQKMWSIYHCSIVAKNVLRNIDALKRHWKNLKALPHFEGFKNHLTELKKGKLSRVGGGKDGERSQDRIFTSDVNDYTEGDALWVFQHRDLFPQLPHPDRVARKVHQLCPLYRNRPGLYSPVWQIHCREDTNVFLSFTAEAAGPWQVFINEPAYVKWQTEQRITPINIGFCNPEASIPSGGKSTVQVIKELGGRKASQISGERMSSFSVVLKSRLLPLGPAILKHRRPEMMRLAADPPELGDTFSIEEWSDHTLNEYAVSGRSPKRVSTIGRPSHSANPEKPTIFKFLSIACVAKDEQGNEKLKFNLELGPPACCYPAGTRICVDVNMPTNNVPMTSPEIAVGTLEDHGVHASLPVGCHLMKDPNKTLEFDPTPLNHIFLTPSQYKKGDRVIYREELNWVDAVVVTEATQENHWMTHLRANMNSEAAAAHSTFAEGMASKQSSEKKKGDETETQDVNRHLTVRNSGFARLPAGTFDEEVSRIKVFYKARHSAIIDALSGARLGVKECAMPTLHVVTKGNGPPSGYSTPGSVSPNTEAKQTGGSVRESKMSRSYSLIMTKGIGGSAEELGGSNFDPRMGWALITSTAEKYEKSVPVTDPNAFLIMGTPGSGKTCLVYRLMNEYLERERNILPVIVPISDLVKRSATNNDTDNEMDSDQVAAWFFKYLQITFGEDSARYRTIYQAIRMHRVLFLFEGLEDAGSLASLIERCIRDIVLDRHLVVITSRPFVGGSCSLEDMSEHITTMKLQNLTTEQRRGIAHTRLGPEGLRLFDSFFKQISEKSSAATAEHGEGEEQEDVFGNPMMLSMLICYLQMKQKELEDQRVTATDSTKRRLSMDGRREDENDANQGVTITSVYRVALDVMLQRVQSKQQADRHNKDEKVEICKKILEKIAMKMHVRRGLEIDVNDVEGLFPSQDMKKEWQALKSSVASGHAMFLRMSTEHGRTELRFLVKGFQNFFAASEIAHGGGNELPALVALITEQWWVQMIEMLSEYSQHRYVQLIERHLETFQPVKGDSFLHIAAEVGHRPVFQHLKLFKEQYQACLWTRNSELQTPLHVAAKKGHTHICTLMLDMGASIDAEDQSGCLPMHLAMTNGHFNTAKSLLERWSESHAEKPKKAAKNKGQAEALAVKVLSQELTEEQFLETVNEIFLELRFFTKAEAGEKKKELGALLAVYWICSNQYEKFVRGQPMESRLTQASWDGLQEWTRKVVKLTETPDTVGAMLVYVAVMRLGAIKSFSAAFAPGLEDVTQALVFVLENHPIMVPSFNKLEPRSQQVILASMKPDFNFGQFLQAENLPGSLNIVKSISEGAGGQGNILGFFLFRVFAAMCGLHGPKSLEGALFMTDKSYSNFKVGLDEMEFLRTESAKQVYNRFLSRRAKSQSLQLNPDDQVSCAKVRLACLARISDSNGGKEVSSCFDQLPKNEGIQLTTYLNTDGIENKPGFLLFNAPSFLTASREGAGLLCGMRMLLRIYQASAKTYEKTDQAIVNIYVDEMVTHAQKTSDKEVFEFTKFEIIKAYGTKADVQGSVRISPWQLVPDYERNDPNREREAEDFAETIMQRTCREQTFILKMSGRFRELFFFVGDNSVREAAKQTQGALLSLFWIVSDLVEAFRRGQAADTKLSDKSWLAVTKLADKCTSDQEYFSAIMVALAISNLGRISKFGEQLAPEARGHKAVLRSVLDNCPRVLPSFCSLEPATRAWVRACVTQQFDFMKFVRGESLPAELVNIRLLAQGCPEEMSPRISNRSSKSARGSVESPPASRPEIEDFSGEECLSAFLLFKLLELSGSLGNESLEGSLYLTEENFALYQMGHKAMSEFKNPDATVQDVYNSLLQLRATACGFFFDANNLESVAVARLACLCSISSQSKGSEELGKVWEAMTVAERSALTKHLTADGIKDIPGFALRDAPAFLENAWANGEVGLLPALRILLRVYDAAAKEFQGSQEPMIVIELGNLTMFAKEFFGSVAFQDMPFEMKRKNSVEALAIPKAWIPVSNPSVLQNLRNQAYELATDLLKNRCAEEQFKSRIVRIFPELSYFTVSAYAQRDRTFCAMLSVYWLITGQQEAFVRSQPDEEMLSRQSWAWIQEWMNQTVKLSSPEAVDAALVFMAIHALGKVPEFRDELAKGFDEHYHDLALAYVLENNASVVPSFARLPRKYQQLINDSLSVDFQFSQFLQAENLPANLVVVKEKLKPHGDDGFAFFCFRIFAQMCGKLGSRNLKGSMFMTESEFQRFRPGLDALQQLRTLDAEAAYQAFLRFRGSKALSRFASPEHQALARLLCLGSAFDYKDGDTICEAFDKLKPASQAALTRWLTSDGIKIRPGYVLCHVPTLLHNAKNNDAVGLRAAFDCLLRVQEMCESTVSSSTSKAVISFMELAAWAKDAGPDPEEFGKATLSLRSESVAETKVFTVDVARPRGSKPRNYSSLTGSGHSDDRPWRWRCLYFFFSVILLAALGGLTLLVLRPDIGNHLTKQLGLAPRLARYSKPIFACIAGVALFLLVCACWCRRRSAIQAVSEPVQSKRPPYMDVEQGITPGTPGSTDGREPLLSRRGYVRLEQTDDNEVA